MRARLFVWLQHLLPRYWMTSAVYRLARVRQTAIKNFLIRRFVQYFKVDVDEVAAQVPDDFATFNDFFVRELNDAARPVDRTANALVSPVDGTVSEAGRIDHGRLLQAKGYYYPLADLLSTDLADAGNYHGGSFVTLYLAPHNYHRVHAPLAGRLVAARYVPGDLYSVNEATVTQLPGLFGRNERLVCHFASDSGPFAVLLVGALNVGSISTPWTGEIRPRRRGTVEEIDIVRSHCSRDVAKGGLLGWFNMGSTVIVLLPRGAAQLHDDLSAGRKVVMGEVIATLHKLTP